MLDRDANDFNTCSVVRSPLISVWVFDSTREYVFVVHALAF